MLQGGGFGFSGDDTVDEGAAEGAVLFQPGEETGFELTHPGEFYYNTRQFFAIVDDEFGGDDDHPAFGASAKGFESFIQESQEFSGKGDGRIAMNIVFDKLDAHLGGIGDNDLHLGTVGELQYILPLIPGGEDAADGRADDIFFDIFRRLDPTDTEGIETILAVEGAGIAAIGGFDDHDPAIEQALAVCFIDEIVGQTAQKDAGAKLEYFFREGEDGVGGFYDVFRGDVL